MSLATSRLELSTTDERISNKAIRSNVYSFSQGETKKASECVCTYFCIKFPEDKKLVSEVLWYTHVDFNLFQFERNGGGIVNQVNFLENRKILVLERDPNEEPGIPLKKGPCSILVEMESDHGNYRRRCDDKDLRTDAIWKKDYTTIALYNCKSFRSFTKVCKNLYKERKTAYPSRLDFTRRVTKLNPNKKAAL